MRVKGWSHGKEHSISNNQGAKAIRAIARETGRQDPRAELDTGTAASDRNQSLEGGRGGQETQSGGEDQVTQQPGQPTPLAFERHYSVREIAEMWNVSGDTVRRIFRGQPGSDRDWSQRDTLRAFVQNHAHPGKRRFKASRER